MQLAVKEFSTIKIILKVKCAVRTQILVSIFISLFISPVQSQIDSTFYRTIISQYNKELPKLQKAAFRRFRKLNSHENIKIQDFEKYQIIIVPSFKLDLRLRTDQRSIIYYTDFKSMWFNYDCYIFKDDKYLGSLFYWICRKSLSSFSKEVSWTLAHHLKNSKADLLFHPDNSSYICGLKDGELYIIDLLSDHSTSFVLEKDYFSNIVRTSNTLCPGPSLKRYKKLR